MNISTKGRYGLRAVLDIACNYQGKPVTLSAISLRQQISEGYLEQLMAPLKKAGIIVSSRGAQGGYSLARDPQDIVVGEIFRALEGPLNLAVCTSEDETTSCKKKDYCSSEGEANACRNKDCSSESEATACSKKDYCGSGYLWEEIQKAIAEVLDSHTLADLVNKETR